MVMVMMGAMIDIPAEAAPAVTVIALVEQQQAPPATHVGFAIIHRIRTDMRVRDRARMLK
jgi:hypothetical protein